MKKDVQNYASELDLELALRHPDPVCRTKEGEEIEKKNIGVWIKKTLVKEHQERTEKQKWQGKRTRKRPTYLGRVQHTGPDKVSRATQSCPQHSLFRSSKIPEPY